METHQIAPHAGAFRIEATTAAGKCWLLSRGYAMARQRAMAEADQQMKALLARLRPRGASA